MSPRRTRTPWLASWAAVVAWMLFIFLLSSQPAEQSNRLSKSVTEVVAVAVQEVAPEQDIDLRQMNRTLRKYAHFFAFFVLGMLVANAWRSSGKPLRQRMVYSLLVCLPVALSDEGHQLLVPGRGGQMRDVWIDSAGAILGIGLFSVFHSWLSSIHAKKR